MKKEERIRKYGAEAYEKLLQQGRDWGEQYREQHHEEHNAKTRKWFSKNPEKATSYHHETDRKGGKRYVRTLKYNSTGLRQERNSIRANHRSNYRPYKKIIAPESQCHHQWVPRTSDYIGVALVEKDQHMYGYIDVIQILEGEITLFTEEEVRGII